MFHPPPPPPPPTLSSSSWCSFLCPRIRRVKNHTATTCNHFDFSNTNNANLLSTDSLCGWGKEKFEKKKNRPAASHVTRWRAGKYASAMRGCPSNGRQGDPSWQNQISVIFFFFFCLWIARHQGACGSSQINYSSQADDRCARMCSSHELLNGLCDSEVFCDWWRFCAQITIRVAPTLVCYSSH